MITVTRNVQFKNRMRLVSDAAPVADPAPQGRIPRVSKLMALAIRFDGLLREGKVTDQSELARLARVTQPRMTQIMNLNNLAPDIQEELLHLPPAHSGRDTIHERMCRPICAEHEWEMQRKLWRALRPPARPDTSE